MWHCWAEPRIPAAMLCPGGKVVSLCESRPSRLPGAVSPKQLPWWFAAMAAEIWGGWSKAACQGQVSQACLCSHFRQAVRWWGLRDNEQMPIGCSGHQAAGSHEKPMCRELGGGIFSWLLMLDAWPWVKHLPRGPRLPSCQMGLARPTTFACYSSTAHVIWGLLWLGLSRKHRQIVPKQ